MRMTLTHRIVVRIKTQHKTQLHKLTYFYYILNARKKSECYLYYHVFIIVSCIFLDNGFAYL